MTDFTLFQVILIPALILLLLSGFCAMLRGWVGRRGGLVWIAVCLAAGTAVVWPEGTSRLARALGIGRGADLLIYCTAMVMLVGFWATYTRLHRLRQEMTQLVRHLALSEAERELTGPGDAEDSSAPNPFPPSSQA